MAERFEESISGDVGRIQVLLAKLRTYQRYSATVQSVLSDGILLINVGGLQNARCYITYGSAPASNYQPNGRLNVAMDESGVCFELPPELPRIGAKTMVVQAIDDSIPPTLGLDWIRFSNAILNPFDPE